MTDQEFAESFGPLISYCQDDLHDDYQRMIYRRALDDLTAENLKQAVLLFILESKDRWFPSVGRIRDLAQRARGGRVLAWDEAWGIVLEAAGEWSLTDREAGKRAWERLPADLKAIVRRLGGLSALNNGTTRDLSIKQALFRGIWQDRSDKRVRQERLPASEQLAKLLNGTAENLSLPQPPKKGGET